MRHFSSPISERCLQWANSSAHWFIKESLVIRMHASKVPIPPKGVVDMHVCYVLPCTDGMIGSNRRTMLSVEVRMCPCRD